MKNAEYVKFSTWNTVLAVLFCAIINMASADDEVVLKAGGRVRGKITPSATDDGSEIRVVTTDGITVTFNEADVKDVVFTGPGAEAYQAELAKWPNTVEGHVHMAKWCADNGVFSRQKIHLRRVIELDPDHAAARRELGYRRSVDGNWYTQAEEMAARGKVLHNGRWITTHELELQTKQKESKAEAAKYTRSIALWRKNLGGKKDAEARANFDALRDPLAVQGITTAWKKEKDPRVEQMYIKILGRIGSIEAKNWLKQVAVVHSSEDIRLACIDELRRDKDPAVTSYFVARLNPAKNDNVRLNRAARALGELGDRTAIPALIDALSTTHNAPVPSSGGNPGQMSATMGGSSLGGGGAGISMGGKPQMARKTVQNKDVLQALERMTGVNFLYDKIVWKNWLKNNPTHSAEE